MPHLWFDGALLQRHHSGRCRVLSLVGGAARTRIENTPVDQTPEATTIRGRYRATLDWYELSNGHWLLRVLNEQGKVVEGGIGDDPEEALLEVYERLVPPK